MVVYLINRHLTSRGTFFILDTLAGTLALPRSGVVLEKSDIAYFVELHAWRKVGSDRYRSCELIAVRDNKDGSFNFHSVAIDDHPRYVARAGQRLCEFFDVPLHVKKTPWWTWFKKR
jgi:hypothetical protein